VSALTIAQFRTLTGLAVEDYDDTAVQAAIDAAEGLVGEYLCRPVAYGVHTHRVRVVNNRARPPATPILVPPEGWELEGPATIVGDEPAADLVYIIDGGDADGEENLA
jgi:hypothetical protein